MHRAVPILFALLVLASVGFVVAHGRARHQTELREADAEATASASATATEPAPTALEAHAPDGGAPPAPQQTELEAILAGGPVPALPNGAPTSVDLAVILFAHDDAQFAPKQSRPKSDAKRLATELIPEAEENFKEAVKKGDPGSTADAGTIPLGVMEPALQYVVFTLEKGQVFKQPLDTPRGYWIVKRIR